MFVVVDANVVISLLIAKGSKHKLFFSDKFIPASPDWMLFEIGKYWKEISEKSKLPESALRSAFFGVRMQLKTFSLSEIKEFIKEGSIISPDPNDSEYFALALKLNCPLWSEDKLLKQQSKVEVLNTRELLVKLGLI